MSDYFPTLERTVFKIYRFARMLARTCLVGIIFKKGIAFHLNRWHPPLLPFLGPISPLPQHPKQPKCHKKQFYPTSLEPSKQDHF